ncbi:hypothetical protein PJN38_24085 [Mycobacterium kansasii]
MPDLTPTEQPELAWSAEPTESDLTTEPGISAIEPAAWFKLASAIAGLIFWLLVIWLMITMCADSKRSASDSSSSLSSFTTPAVQPYETMPGDGTYGMGGIDGKNWGIWQSAGSSSRCQWSIRAVSRYTDGQVLDSGEVGPGVSARVNIQPLGETSLVTGETGGFRIVFMTGGCGSWRLAD